MYNPPQHLEFIKQITHHLMFLHLSIKHNSLYTQGNYTQAIQLFDKALALDPNFRQALNGKGDALYSLANDTQGYVDAYDFVNQLKYRPTF